MKMTDYVTVRIAETVIGIDSKFVQDVFYPRGLTPVPMAPAEVLGVLNLRGRIVTAICMRRRLGLPPRPAGARPPRAVGVDVDGDSYGLVVDDVEEVLKLDSDALLSAPGSLPEAWRDVVGAVHRLPDGLLLIADVRRVALADAMAG